LSSIELKRAGSLSYREAVPAAGADDQPVLLVHGFPQSSRMWVGLMEALAAAGRRSVAPDLYCLGDSTDPGPATYERNREALAELVAGLDLGPVALVVHDWGGFVGLSWACEHPELVSAMVISDAGFFSYGRWHGIAEAIRASGGEALVEAIDRDGFAAMLRGEGARFSELSASLKQKDYSGVLLDQLDPKSRLAYQGLAKGDIVTGVNRRRVRNLNDFKTSMQHLNGALYLQIVRGQRTYVARID